MADLPLASAQPLPAALKTSDLLPGTRQYAALYLRWHVPSPLRQRLQAVLEQALAPLQERCERASVQLLFSAVGEYWQLRCAGQPAAVLRAVEQALALMLKPATSCWQPSTATPPPLIPIRALLKQLPDAVVGAHPASAPASMPTQSQLDSLWQHARWHGLATGFDAAALSALGTALQHCPGQGSLPAPAYMGQPPLAARRSTRQ